MKGRVVSFEYEYKDAGIPITLDELKEMIMSYYPESVWFDSTWVDVEEFKDDPGFYMMFKSKDNNVFGLINYLEWFPSNRRRCERNVSDEISLYEAYICINGKIYRGCATIERD